jgi:hypothetical protein
MIRFGAKVWARAAVLGVPMALVGWGVACSSSSSNGSTSGALGSDGGNGAETSTGVAENFDAMFDGQATLTLKWVVTEQPAFGYGYGDAGGVNAGAGDGGMSVVPGVQVCVYGSDGGIPCVTTDDNGIFNLGGLPPRTNLVISLTKDGYGPVLKAIQTASSDMDGTSNPVRMLLSDDPAPPIGVAVDWTTHGSLSFFALDEPADAGGNFVADIGAAVALTPSAGNGPFYLNGAGDVDLDASALELGGVGAYYNVPPGNYTLTFNDPVNNCAPIDVFFAGYGFPDPPTSVQFPIVAGYTTELVGVICTPKPHLIEAGP